jgi:UDP-2-acetamido-3-amino-2,3-dideoxy-glucuronate N-acetyltransferase
MVRYSECVIDPSTRIFDYCNVYGGTIIGPFCKIGAFSELSGAVLGKRVTVAAMCFIPKGITLEDDVWIGPRVTFCNDKRPPSDPSTWSICPTVVKTGAVIGAGAVILPGVTIGEKAMIGAGAVVTKDVPANETWVGNPARKL